MQAKFTQFNLAILNADFTPCLSLSNLNSRSFHKKFIIASKKKLFVITHLLIFTTLNFANHFANSQKRIKYEKDTFRLYGFDSVAFWG